MHSKQGGWRRLRACVGMLLALVGTQPVAVGQAVHTSPWATTAPATLPPPASLTKGVWLKGDLHVHSRHSKESTNNPIAKIVAFSQSEGLDYLAITDHDNHVDGDVAHHTWADPEFKASPLLMLYAAEWTTVRGHGNALSARPYDHQRLYDVRDQRDVVVGAIKRELGIHLSANHPSSKDHFGYSYDMLESLEVWNSVIWANNANAQMIWDDMLSSGRRLTGRGGSDAHHGRPATPAEATPNSPQAEANYVGTPTTWVFAAARTTQAVIDALTAGRVSVSANPFAPRVEFYADLNQDGQPDVMMGDNALATGQPVRFRVQLVGQVPAGAAYSVRVVKNGNPLDTLQLSGKYPVVEFTDTPAAAARSYYRVLVEGPPTPYPQVPKSMALSAPMVGLSNPIYFNFDPHF